MQVLAFNHQSLANREIWTDIGSNGSDMSRLVAATSAFLDDASTAPQDRAAFLDYLNARPNRRGS
ncbi:hypothetical protein IMZ48_41675 [Candidatus Bathyarchaeota archaeon]|nr:hypothetical protein [Candidatus Bathyarchaeota archaeon]